MKLDELIGGKVVYQSREYPRTHTCSIVDKMGKRGKKFSAIRNPVPSGLIVFMDEDAFSIKACNIGLRYYPETKWGDGNSERWRWQSTHSFLRGKPRDEAIPDLRLIQRHLTNQPAPIS